MHATSLKNTASSLCLLDDSPWVFQTYPALLAEALGLSVQTLLHDAQTGDEIVQEMLKMSPDILLCDCHLAEEVEGPWVMREILKSNPRMRIIGFSSDPGYAEACMRAGAIGVVRKHRDDPMQSVREVTALVRH